MNAHRLVIIAAALTIIVAAALATALASFSGQALPRAVRHDLNGANGTALVITGNVDASQAAQYTSMLPARISSALDRTPFAFYQADWSDPLGFVPGSRPARRPARATRRSPRPPHSLISPRTPRWSPAGGLVRRPAGSPSRRRFRPRPLRCCT